jgi:hypothetical protein
MMIKKSLLHIIELGNYPDLSNIFQRLNLEVHQANSMRKGLAELNKLNPDILLAEFNYLPTYGTQISTIEPLLAKLQTHHPDTRVILFYEKERLAYVEELAKRYEINKALPYPINKAILLQTLQSAISA